MKKKYALVSAEGWINEWCRFVSRGKECFSYMTSWNKKERMYFTAEEAKAVQMLFPYPVRIEECA